METKEQRKKQVEVSILPINLATATFPIASETSLLMDKMPLETLKEIEDKQKGKSKSGKKLRDIDREIEQAIHYLPDKTIGFPASAFKTGMIESTSFVGNKMFSKKLIKGLKILNATDGLIPIRFKKQTILVHNIGSNTKHTPQFHEWSCELVVQFDRNNISEKDIATLINYAGFYSGVGIWSPRCRSGGDFGMYKLKTK